MTEELTKSITDMQDLAAKIKQSGYKEGVADTLYKFLDEVPNWLCAISGQADEYAHGYEDCGKRVLELVKKIAKDLVQ